MNFSSNSLISSSESASKLMNKLHSMPWLKQNSCDSPKQKMSQDEGNRGERSFLSKKTDEDYFSGTREEKKGKKIRKRKEKIVLDVNYLDRSVQRSSEKVVSNSKKESEPWKSSCEKKNNSGFKAPFDTSPAVTDPASKGVWSTNSNVANVLFPNVKSVIIDRTEEEEMLSRAMAESIATIQLERFKREAPKKEEKKTPWDVLYGDDKDDGGWDNVRINLPVETARTIPRRIVGDIRRRKNWDTNNNASSKPGILRNKDEDARRSILRSENLDFGFKKSSDNSDEEIKKVQSPKSVAFGETVAIEIDCDEPAEDRCVESEPRSNGVSKVSKGNGEPVIDKFGRVDGYSERRLFMGKGARLKEQLYIQNKSSLDKTLKEGQKNIPKTAKDDTEDIVEEAKRSPLKSHKEKPLSKQTSLDRDIAATDSTEAIVSCSSVKKFDKQTSEKAIQIKIDAPKQIENKKTDPKMGSKGSKVESTKVEAISRCEKSIEKPKKIQINITSTFHDSNGEARNDGKIADRNPSHTTNVDKKKTEKEDSTVENPVPVIDAPKSRAPQKNQDREADFSTVTDSKREERVSKFASENPQNFNPVSGITEMVISPPSHQGSVSTESPHREQYLAAPNLVREDLNLKHYQILNNHIEWQSYQNVPTHISSSNYDYNHCPIPGYSDVPNHLQIPPNVHPYTVYDNVPYYLPYWSDMLTTHPFCGMPSYEDAGRSVSLPTIDYKNSSSINARAENRTNRFMAAQPGAEFVSVPDLPPGFTWRKPAQRICVDNCERTFVNRKSNSGNNLNLHIPGQTPHQDNYFASNTHSPIPEVHQFAMCNNPSLQNSEYVAAPYSSFTHYHVPDQYPPGLCGNIPEWRFSVNTTNSPPLQPRPIPRYSPSRPCSFGGSGTAAPNLNINRSKGNIFGDDKIGRGRGRLTQRDFM